MAGKNEQKIYDNMKSLEEWAFAGISQKDMAEMLDMSYSAFRELKSKIPALSALLKKSADFLKSEEKKQTAEVEASLYKRCLGYDAPITKHYKVKVIARSAEGTPLFSKEGKPITEEQLVEVTEKTHVPADVGAMKFYLLNKARKDWKNDPDRLEIEKKRLANDTKRTKIAENAASGPAEGANIEDYLEAAEKEAGAGEKL